MKREPLTERQAEVLAYIKSHIAKLGYAPSVRDIGENFAIVSPNGVAVHLKALTKKGYLKQPRNEAGRALARAFIVVD